MEKASFIAKNRVLSGKYEFLSKKLDFEQQNSSFPHKKLIIGTQILISLFINILFKRYIIIEREKYLLYLLEIGPLII